MSYPPPPPLRSFSTNSSQLSLNFNKASSSKDHLFYICETLRRKLQKIPNLQPFLNQAFSQAEQLSEEQSLTLAQEQTRIENNQLSNSNDSLSNDLNRLSLQSNNSQNSLSRSNTSSSNTTTSRNLSSNNILTFTAGILPASISVDPATQLWKLFQMGAPLCIIFNHIYPKYQIPIISSDDLRICKKSVYEFLIAVKTHLKFDDDKMFTISNVFSDSTQDLIKITQVVNQLLKDVKGLSLEEDDESIAKIILTDERSKVFREIIETERKYVSDLDLLSKYRNELIEAELLSSEQIHSLFPNLTEIIDFQKRFLNGLECNINVPYKFQRIGSIFIHASLGPFKAYEPWTVGQLSAIDLIQKETLNLKKSSTLIDPGFELQSFILKPIQRLCKYPLLLKELIKTTTPKEQEENYSIFNELLIAKNSMIEVANQVNEAQRRAENVENFNLLIGRVNNWRGFNLKDQGDLLLFGKVLVKDSDSEKEYVAYLFEKIIFFFIEVDNQSTQSHSENKLLKFGSRKKSTSSNSSSSSNLTELNTKSQLELKGRVYISEIYNVSSPSLQGYTLIISWSGKKESGSFTLKYRTEEIRNQWEQCLRNLKTVEMNQHMNKKLRNSNSSTDSNIYEYTGTPSSTDAKYANSGSRHHSSSSTLSMMRNVTRVRSGDLSSSSRLSSSSSTNLTNYSSSTTPTSANNTISNQFEIVVRIIYNSIEMKEKLLISSLIQFNELYSKISNKIVNSNLVTDDILINKLRYKDEDGDFVVMDSNDDWNLAIDMLQEMDLKELTLWIS